MITGILSWFHATVICVFGAQIWKIVFMFMNRAKTAFAPTALLLKTANFAIKALTAPNATTEIFCRTANSARTATGVITASAAMIVLAVPDCAEKSFAFLMSSFRRKNMRKNWRR